MKDCSEKHRWMKGISEAGYVYCVKCGRRKDIVESLNIWNLDESNAAPQPDDDSPKNQNDPAPLSGGTNNV